jgi:hypothetical protein
LLDLLYEPPAALDALLPLFLVTSRFVRCELCANVPYVFLRVLDGVERPRLREKRDPGTERVEIDRRAVPPNGGPGAYVT